MKPGPSVNFFVLRRFVVQFEFAIAAIAAAAASLTQVVGARILCAMRADVRRFGLANTTDEFRWCHFVGVYFDVPFVFFGATFRTGG